MTLATTVRTTRACPGLWAACAACVVLLSACERKTEPTTDSAGVPPGAEMSRDTGEMPGGALTPERVASVAYTANQGEIEMGQLAVRRASDPRVRQFAQRMIDDHSAANQKLASVQRPATDAGPLAMRLQDDARRIEQSLEAADEKTFDRAYMDSQVLIHRRLLDELDNTLIPAATDARFRTLLQEFRGTVEQHLRMAQDIQKSLGKSGR